MLKRLTVITAVLLTALLLQFLQNKVLVGEQELVAEIRPVAEAPAGEHDFDVVLKDVAGNPTEATAREADEMRKRLASTARGPAIPFKEVVFETATKRLRVTAPDTVDTIALTQRLTSRPYPRDNEARSFWHVNLGIDLRGGVEFTCRLKNDDNKVVPANDEVIATLRNRLDERGLTEPVVARLSNGDVQIVIPGGSRADAARTRKVLETTGRLEFREVIATYPNKDFPSGKAGDPACAWIHSGGNIYRFNPLVPVGTRQDIIAGQESKLGGEPTQFYHLGPVQLSGKDVADAHESMQGGEMGVGITFTALGAGKNHEFTSSTKERGDRGAGTGRIAIVFDGLVKSAPVVREPSSANCLISGSFTSEEIKDLRGVLKAGSLAVTPEILSERVVGATLGQTEISRAMTTMLWTLAVLFIFLAGYYRKLGLVAICSVLVNGALTWTALAVFGSTLTLPGIAGLILSLAMGIDTNILIYERIREELREDKGIAAAIEAGYARAFMTVLDSHLTTISAAFVLYMIGSGPIKGFGLTLMIGIAISLFSGIYVGRLLTDFLLRRSQHVSMASVFKPLHIGYVRLRFISYTLTFLTAVVGIGYFAFGHHLHQNATFERNFDIEFTGGTMVQVSFAKPVDSQQVEEAIAKAWAGMPEAQRGESLLNPREIQKQPYFTSMAQAEKSSRQWVFRVRDEKGAVFERERQTLETKQVALIAEITKLRELQPPDVAGARKLEREQLQPLAKEIKVVSDHIADRTDAFKRELAGAFSGLVAAEGEEIQTCTWKDRRITMRVATLDAPTHLQADEIGRRLAQLGSSVTCVENGNSLELAFSISEIPKPAANAPEAVDRSGQRCAQLLEAATEPKLSPAEAAAIGAVASNAYESLVNVAAGQRVAVAQPYPASQHFSGQVADRMKFQALIALSIALVAMMLYIAARFEMAFGLGAVISLLHVVIQTLGVIALMGIRIDLTIVAAFLTIVGYAINDTIVTFDRIRENIGKMAGKPLETIIDQSVAEVMPRTILTGGHVALALGIMIYFGGESLHGFCTTLLVGILLGTYSSVFVASPLLMLFRRQVLVPNSAADAAAVAAVAAVAAAPPAVTTVETAKPG